MLNDLVLEEDRQRTLFDAENPKSRAMMATLDKINERFGKKTMVLASEGMKHTWKVRSDHQSPKYTTRISELPVVR